MSRSFKKNPIAKDIGFAQAGKTYANRRVRRNDDSAASRGMYKKIYNSWAIHDYISYCSKEQAIAQYRKRENEEYFRKYFPTLESFLECWEKGYRRK